MQPNIDDLRVVPPQTPEQQTQQVMTQDNREGLQDHLKGLGQPPVLTQQERLREAENRILTPDEAENLLMTGQLESQDADSAQQEMMDDFFAGLPEKPSADPTASGLPQPGQPVPVQQQVQPAQPVPVVAAPAAAPAALTPPVPLAAAAVPAGVSPEVSAVQAQLTMVQSELQNTRAQLAAAQHPTQAAPAGSPAAQPELPQYNFQIPDGLFDMLRSEDVSQVRQGLSAFAQGVAQSVHHQVREELGARMEQIPQSVMGQVSQQQRQTEIFNDFYGDFPELNTPQMRAMIPGVVQQLQHEGFTEYSPQLKQMIAHRMAPMSPAVQSRLAQQVPRVVQQQVPPLPPAAVAPAVPQNYGLPVGSPVGSLSPAPLNPAMQYGQVAPVAAQPAAPMLARDAYGNLIPIVAPVPQLPTGVRPSNGNPADAELQDLWSTLDYF